MMKKMTIIWGIVMVLVFAGLTTFGFLYTARSKEYKKLELVLEDAGKKYGDINYSYQEVDKDMKIKVADLIKEEYLDELKVNDDICDGYVLLSKNTSEFEYKGYIKCSKYTTPGF